jgi:hypothetical protein
MLSDTRKDNFKSDHLASDAGSLQDMQEDEDQIMSASMILEAFQYRDEPEDEREYFRIAGEIIQGSNSCGLAVLAMDQRGYIVACSSGIEAMLQLSLPSILSRDIITIFTDERFQQEIAIYLEIRNTVALNKYALQQTTDTGTILLDISLQRLCCSENNHIGFLCFAKDVTKK